MIPVSVSHDLGLVLVMELHLNFIQLNLNLVNCYYLNLVNWKHQLNLYLRLQAAVESVVFKLYLVAADVFELLQVVLSLELYSVPSDLGKVVQVVQELELSHSVSCQD